jgi:hypothetical protein
MADLWEKTKTYLVEQILQKAGPVAAAMIVSSLTALAAAHQAILEQWGVTFGTWPLSWVPGQEPSGRVILIELDTLSQTALVMLSGVLGIVITLAVHHSKAAVAALLTPNPLKNEK